MNYYDVYFSRANYMGSSPAEVAINRGKRSFEQWLRQTPAAVDLSVERGLYFTGAIVSYKEDPNKVRMNLQVAVDIPLRVGDIVNWGEEKWLLYQKEKKVAETYQTFYMVKCNYYIKWVDTAGHLQGSWCYFVSSMDSKIKENFRTWNSLGYGAFSLKELFKSY